MLCNWWVFLGFIVFWSEDLMNIHQLFLEPTDAILQLLSSFLHLLLRFLWRKKRIHQDSKFNTSNLSIGVNYPIISVMRIPGYILYSSMSAWFFSYVEMRVEKTECCCFTDFNLGMMQCSFLILSHSSKFLSGSSSKLLIPCFWNLMFWW